jgi:hypothetical protein
VKTVCDGLLVYGWVGGHAELVYEEHEIIALPWLECRVCRRGRHENVRFVEEGDITAETCKWWSLKTTELVNVARGEEHPMGESLQGPPLDFPFSNSKQ